MYLSANLLRPPTHESSGFAVVLAEAPDTAATQQNKVVPSA